jgi:hypothetical protein
VRPGRLLVVQSALSSLRRAKFGPHHRARVDTVLPQIDSLGETNRTAGRPCLVRVGEEALLACCAIRPIVIWVSSNCAASTPVVLGAVPSSPQNPRRIAMSRSDRMSKTAGASASSWRRSDSTAPACRRVCMALAWRRLSSAWHAGLQVWALCVLGRVDR